MTDNLFTLPESSPPPLESARRRLETAETAFSLDNNPDTAREFMEARSALLKLETNTPT